MSLGNLKNEADLERYLASYLQRPGVMPTNASAPIALMKAGPPSDGDFPNTPGNGILAYDTEGELLYARVNDEWKPV